MALVKFDSLVKVIVVSVARDLVEKTAREVFLRDNYFSPVH